MNLPNQLTMFRLLLAGVFVGCMSIEFAWHYGVALLVFGVAALTDYFDGAIARKRGLITDFGKLMDPLADKILTAAAFICLIPIPKTIPAWAVILVISREFLITGLRLLASSEGRILPAEKIGKHKTVWQMVLIIYYLLLLSLEDFLPPQAHHICRDVAGPVLMWFVVILTLYSGLAYFVRNRDVVQAK